MHWRVNFWPVMAKGLPALCKAFYLIKEKITAEMDEITLLAFQKYDRYTGIHLV